MNDIDKMIIVCGHGIYKNSAFAISDVKDYRNWVPERADQAKFYYEHIRKGIELAQADPKLLLLFSGGQTRKVSGPPISEAACYRAIAHQMGWLNSAINAEIEEYARDSLENLLFGICRFSLYRTKNESELWS